MSHRIGYLGKLSTPWNVPPGPSRYRLPSGLPKREDGLRFVMLGFGALPAGSTLTIDLGYDTDVLHPDPSDGVVWSRPLPPAAFDGQGVAMSLNGGSGTARLTVLAYGQPSAGIANPKSGSNCDPFLLQGRYEEPTYDWSFYSTTPFATPAWSNVRCGDPGDVRRRSTPAAGMLVMLHGHLEGLHLSSCSATLVAPRILATAGHCLFWKDDADALGLKWPLSHDEWLIRARQRLAGTSACFDVETLCNGDAPPGYSPRFFRVIDLLDGGAGRFNGVDYDFALLRIAVPPGVLLTASEPGPLPAVGAAVFAVHHPGGAVKKTSPPYGALSAALQVSADGITAEMDVTGGSSGSGLFDSEGRTVGISAQSVATPAGRRTTWFPLQTVQTAPSSQRPVRILAQSAPIPPVIGLQTMRRPGLNLCPATNREFPAFVEIRRFAHTLTLLAYQQVGHVAWTLNGTTVPPGTTGGLAVPVEGMRGEAEISAIAIGTRTGSASARPFQLSLTVPATTEEPANFTLDVGVAAFSPSGEHVGDDTVRLEVLGEAVTMDASFGDAVRACLKELQAPGPADDRGWWPPDAGGWWAGGDLPPIVAPGGARPWELLPAGLLARTEIPRTALREFQRDLARVHGVRVSRAL